MPAERLPLLLVHGAGHGAWCWAHLLPELSARGIVARAIDLPGHGPDRTPPGQVTLAGYGAAIRAAVADLGGRAHLLGHSAGGYAITAAANTWPEMVGKLIYLAAYLPVSGQSLSEMRKVWHEQPLLPAIRRSPDGTSFSFDPEQVVGLCYHDCEPALAAWARDRLGPEPLPPQNTAMNLSDGFHALEKHYIVCGRDRVIPPGYQRVMAGRLPAGRASELDASHSPFLSMPGVLADGIARILAE